MKLSDLDAQLDSMSEKLTAKVVGENIGCEIDKLLASVDFYRRELLYRKMTFLLFQEKWAELDQVSKVLIEAWPTVSEAVSSRADYYLYAGLWESAIELYEESLELWTDQDEVGSKDLAMQRLVECYYVVEKVDDALRVCRMALEESHFNQRAWRKLLKEVKSGQLTKPEALFDL